MLVVMVLLPLRWRGRLGLERGRDGSQLLPLTTERN